MRYMVAPRHLLPLVFLLTPAPSASAQVPTPFGTLLTTLLSGLGQKLLAPVARSGDDKQKAKENAQTDSLLKTSIRTALEPFTLEANDLTRLRETNDVGRRALAAVRILAVFASSRVQEHRSGYDSLSTMDMAYVALDSYQNLAQILSGAKFNDLAAPGVSPWLFAKLKDQRTSIVEHWDGLTRKVGDFTKKGLTPTVARDVLDAVRDSHDDLQALDATLSDVSVGLSSRIELYVSDLAAANKKLGLQ